MVSRCSGELLPELMSFCADCTKQLRGLGFLLACGSRPGHALGATVLG
jgi:hypothetical protein